jgi:hypothetical protein
MTTKVKVMPKSNRLRRAAMMLSYINVEKPGSRNRIKEVINIAQTSKTVNNKKGKKKRSVKIQSPLRKPSVKGKRKENY